MQQEGLVSVCWSPSADDLTSFDPVIKQLLETILYTRAVDNNWHSRTWMTRCSWCLRCSVWMWIFRSLASCSASTRFASCSARSPSSYFSADSCIGHSVADSQVLSGTVVHIVYSTTFRASSPCWRLPPPGLVFWVSELYLLLFLSLFLVLLLVSLMFLAPAPQPSPSASALQYEALGPLVPTTDGSRCSNVLRGKVPIFSTLCSWPVPDSWWSPLSSPRGCWPPVQSSHTSASLGRGSGPTRLPASFSPPHNAASLISAAPAMHSDEMRDRQEVKGQIQGIRMHLLSANCTCHPHLSSLQLFSLHVDLHALSMPFFLQGSLSRLCFGLFCCHLPALLRNTKDEGKAQSELVLVPALSACAAML